MSSTFQPRASQSVLIDVSNANLSGLSESAVYPSESHLQKTPQLLQNEDHEKIKALPKAKQAKWRSLFYKGFALQQAEGEGWITLCEEMGKAITELPQFGTVPRKDSENGLLGEIIEEEREAAEAEGQRQLEKYHLDRINKLKDKHLAYRKYYAKSFADFNKTIQSHSQATGNPKTMGMIESFSLKYPALASSAPGPSNDKKECDEAEARGGNTWDQIHKDRILKEKINELYSLGYVLQLDYNAHAFCPSETDACYEDVFRGEMQKLNNQIGKITTSRGHKVRTMFDLRLPDNGENILALDGDSSFIPEETGADVKAVPFVGKVPKDIHLWRVSIGGPSGILSQLMDCMDENFDIQNADIAQRWQRQVKIVQSLALKNQHPVNAFNVNIEGIKATRDALKNATLIVDGLKSNPHNKQNQAQFLFLRNQVSNIVDTEKLPKNWVDVYIPPMSFVNADYSMQVATIDETPPPLQVMEDMKRLLGPDSQGIRCVGRVLRSYATGNPSPEADSEFLLLQENLWTAMGEHFGHEELITYTLQPSQLQLMCKNFENVMLCRQDKTKSTHDVQLMIDNVKRDFPLLHGAITSTEETDELQEDHSQGTPPPPGTSGNNHSHGTPPPPDTSSKGTPKPNIRTPFSTINSMAQCLPKPTAIVGSVIDKSNGKTITKQIQAYRMHVKFTEQPNGEILEEGSHYQVLLRHEIVKDRPIFEWKRGHRIVRAAELFKEANGERFSAGTGPDLRKARWNDLHVGGVAFAERGDKKYVTPCPCHILLINTKANSSWTDKWFTISTLRAKFGTCVDEERDEYCAATGQFVPKKIPNRKELAETIDNLTARVYGRKPKTEYNRRFRTEDLNREEDNDGYGSSDDSPHTSDEDFIDDTEIDPEAQAEVDAKADAEYERAFAAKQRRDRRRAGSQ